MGKLIIDGNSFFEIDEECIKKKRISPKCGLEKYIHVEDKQEEKTNHERKTMQNFRKE